MERVLSLLSESGWYWLSILLDAGIKGVILLAVAGAVCLALRRGSAATRHLLWLGALGGLVVLPVMSALLPAWQIPILPNHSAPVETLAPEDEIEIGYQEDSFDSTAFVESANPPVLPALEAQPSSPIPVEAAAVVTETAEPEEPEEPFPWSAWVLAGWLAGIFITLAPLLVGTAALGNISWRCQRVTDGPLAAMLNRLSGQLGMRKRIRLLQGAAGQRLMMPIVWGAVRPVVLLPAGSGNWPTDRLRVVLLHELAHIKRWDWLTQLAAYLVRSIYWFHPLVWVAVRQLRIERERACDDLVLAGGFAASDYAGHLLEIVRDLRSPRPLTAAAVAMARSSQIEKRLRAILDATRSRRALTRAAILAVFLMVTCVVLPLASMQPTTRAGDMTEPVAKDADMEEPSETENNSQKKRVVHFPKDRSLGMLKVQDMDAVEGDGNWWWGLLTEWKYFREAKGEIVVPPGKRLGLVVSPESMKELSSLAELQPEDLYMLTIRCHRRAENKPGDKCMSHLSKLTGLKTLFLEYPNIGNEALQGIRGLQSLEKLSFISAQLDDSGMAHIAELKSLKGLRFYSEKVTNTGLSYLSNLRMLEELFPDGGGMNDDGLFHLAKLPSVRYLVLGMGNLSYERGLAHLKDAPSLQKLDLSRPQLLTDTGLANISNLAKLEELTIRNTIISDQELAHLKPMRSLKKLTLQKPLRADGSALTDEGLAHLKRFQSLECLSLYYGNFTDKGLEHLSDLNKLKTLVIPNAFSFTDAGLGHVGKLRSLEELSLRGDSLTDAGMSLIGTLSKLKKLSFMTCPKVTNAGLARLKTLKSLNKLRLYAPKVSISGLNQLNACSNLADLVVHGGIGQDDSVLNIAGLTKLEKLDLGGVVRDEDLACLGNLPLLKWLEIRGDGTISDAGLQHLANLTTLERLLFVGNQHLTDIGLSHLAKMKHLNHLRISGDITDKGLRRLETFKGLTYLRIVSRNDFSKAALQRLKTKLPNLMNIETERKELLRPTKRRELPSHTRQLVGIGKVLPNFKDIQINFDPAHAQGKPMLVCFWDMDQRSSRHCIKELAKKADDLKAKGIVVVGIHASNVDENVLKNWLSKNKITFPVGTLTGDVEKTLFKWGVKSRPWLILTDTDHIVHAEGFSLSQLEEKIRMIHLQ